MTEQEHPAERAPEQTSANQPQRKGQSPQPGREERATKRPRPDTQVHGVLPGARKAMERGGDDTFDEPSFAKGANAQPADRTGLPYTEQDRQDLTRNSTRPIFPDSPGGNEGAVPLSPERHTFIENMMQLGHFDSPDEARKWARAVFDALRARAEDVDNIRGTIFDKVVRVGEAPEVQLETMMWGEGFAERFLWLIERTRGMTKDQFCRDVANYARGKAGDPWCEAAIYAFFGAVKRTQGYEGDKRISDLGELQEIWDRS